MSLARIAHGNSNVAASCVAINRSRNCRLGGKLHRTSQQSKQIPEPLVRGTEAKEERNLQCMLTTAARNLDARWPVSAHCAEGD